MFLEMDLIYSIHCREMRGHYGKPTAGSFLAKSTAELPWTIFLLYVNTEYGMWSTEKRKSFQSETSPTIFDLL